MSAEQQHEATVSRNARSLDDALGSRPLLCAAADIMAFYGRARVAADAVVAELDIEAHGTAWTGETVSLRWVLIHMIEETTRHVGHMDILGELIDRELIDGATGDHEPA